MITSSIHGVFLSAACSAQLLGLRATGVTHPTDGAGAEGTRNTGQDQFSN
jgi:hypothetical protein